jgi:hypothetical protein
MVYWWETKGDLAKDQEKVRKLVAQFAHVKAVEASKRRRPKLSKKTDVFLVEE